MGGGTRRTEWSLREASLAAAVELDNEWRRLARGLTNCLAKDGGGFVK